MTTVVNQSRGKQYSCGLVIVSIVDVNECHSNPCANGATCTDGVNQYSCSCAAGYAGSDCKTGITIEGVPTFSTWIYRTVMQEIIYVVIFC